VGVERAPKKQPSRPKRNNNNNNNKMAKDADNYDPYAYAYERKGDIKQLEKSYMVLY
jgi:hypothetical protein